MGEGKITGMTPNCRKAGSEMNRMVRYLILIGVILLVRLPLVSAQGPDTGPYQPTLTLGRGMVRSVAWSPTGDRIAVGGALGIWLYTPDLKEVGLLKGHTKAVYGVAFSPDGTRLASASHDLTVRVWDVAEQTELFKFEGHTGLVVAVAWSPDRGWPYLVSGSYDGTVRLWNVQSGQATRVLTDDDCGSSWVNQVAVTPDNANVISANYDGKLCVWNWSGRIVRVVDGTPSEWAHLTGQPAAAFIGPHSMTRMQSWSPDGTQIATADWDSRVWIADAASGDILLNQPAHTDWITAVGWIADGSHVTANTLDGQLLIWEAATGNLQIASPGEMNPVPLPALNADGSQQVTLDDVGIVRILDTATGSVIAELPGMANAAAWSPDGTRLAVANRNGTITIWSETP
jgi:WD40 repeat protein